MAYSALILSLFQYFFAEKNEKIEIWEKHQNYYIQSYFKIVYFAGFNNGANLNIVVLWGALLTFNVNKQKLDWIGEKYILCTEFFKFLHQVPQGAQVGLNISQKKSTLSCVDFSAWRLVHYHFSIVWLGNWS